MEDLYVNLSEMEFSKSRKVLLWIFASLFFLTGVYIVIRYSLQKQKTISLSIATVPFAISIFVSILGYMVTFRKVNHYFIIDSEKIEFIYGFFNPTANLFKWQDVKEIHMPHKERKALLMLKDGSKFLINLTWLEKKKSSQIRRHLFYAAREKNIEIVKVNMFSKYSFVQNRL
jgi:hypothetical protein